MYDHEIWVGVLSKNKNRINTPGCTNVSKEVNCICISFLLNGGFLSCHLMY